MRRGVSFEIGYQSPGSLRTDILVFWCVTGRRAKTAHFTEGWVEFVDNRVAKAVAEMLNAEPIGAASGGSGGGKGGKRAGGRGLRRWKDEVWTMKYLSGFKWYMLSEQLGA